MEGGSVPGEPAQFLQESPSLLKDREAIIQASYELVCSGRHFSEILAEVKRLSAVATTGSIAKSYDEICAAGAPCGGASEAEKLQTADLSRSPGSSQPEVPSGIERRARRWPAVGLFLLSLVAATCAIAAVGIWRISVWPLPVDRWGAETVAYDAERQHSSGSPALAAVARVDVPTSATVSLPPTAATSGFEESGQYPMPQDKHRSRKTAPEGLAQPSVLPLKRAQNNVSNHHRATTVLRARGAAGFSPGRPVWQYDRLIGRYVPLSGSSAPRYQ